MLCLLFQIGQDRYAVETRQAVEVVPLLLLKRIPQAARGVAGIFNYRGRPVPAVDLSELTTGVPARELLSTRIIILQHRDRAGREQLLGLIAEHATELLQREDREFVSHGVEGGANFLGPVLMDDQGLIQLVRPQHLLPGEVREALFEQVAELTHEDH